MNDTGKSVTLKDVIVFLSLEKLSSEDLSRVSAVVHERFKTAQARAARVLAVGDNIKWRGKYGETVTGRVTKVNRVTIKCTTDSGVRWTVSPTLVTLV